MLRAAASGSGGAGSEVAIGGSAALIGDPALPSELLQAPSDATFREPAAKADARSPLLSSLPACCLSVDWGCSASGPSAASAVCATSELSGTCCSPRSAAGTLHGSVCSWSASSLSCACSTADAARVGDSVGDTASAAPNEARGEASDSDAARRAARPAAALLVRRLRGAGGAARAGGRSIQSQRSAQAAALGSG